MREGARMTVVIQLLSSHASWKHTYLIRALMGPYPRPAHADDWLGGRVLGQRCGIQDVHCTPGASLTESCVAHLQVMMFLPGHVCLGLLTPADQILRGLAFFGADFGPRTPQVDVLPSAATQSALLSPLAEG